MKSITAILLLAGFIGIAVFCVFAMYHGNGHDAGFSGCIGALVQGADCPQAGGWASSVAFHLATFRVFSTAWFSAHIVALLFALLLLVGYTFSSLRFHVPSRAASRRVLLGVDLSFSLSTQVFTRWLALHENSPATL